MTRLRWIIPTRITGTRSTWTRRRLPMTCSTSGAWHTWPRGRLGAGGSAIYMLDVTDPTPARFNEANAAALVIGEWNPNSLSCSGNSTCGRNLGNTYGVP